MDSQFIKSTFQEPLQFGLARPCGNIASDSLLLVNSQIKCSLESSGEGYKDSTLKHDVNKKSSEKDNPETLPIKTVEHLVLLEQTVASLPQFEALQAHLQLLQQHKGPLNETFESFIADSALLEVEFSQTSENNNGYAMQRDFVQITEAIKKSWFPDYSEKQFESTMVQLISNAHDRLKTMDENEKVLNQDEAKTSQGITTKNVAGSEPQLNNSTAVVGQNQMLDQWYLYATYYRDRYRVTKKANDQLKKEYAEQSKTYRRRIKRCLEKVHAMEQYLDILEQRL